MKSRASVVIPNLNGKAYMEKCLDSLGKQSVGEVPVIVVDNGSTDGSRELIAEKYPGVRLIALDRNYGFCRAVNEGIKAADTEYVILLNNDIEADPGLVKYLTERMDSSGNIFSCQAKMLQMDHPDRIDSAGDEYCALGWAFSMGKGQPASRFSEPRKIFSACGGAAVYRSSMLKETGLFDEAHFAYLEDVDIGYRAQILGYENWFEPKAVVYHKGSAASGSRYNAFKVSHASRNNLYLLYKNMARWQFLINLPLILAGCLIKFVFFIPKGLAHIYLKGLWDGVLLARQGERFDRIPENFDNCCRIQLRLWGGLWKLLRKNK